MGQIDKSHTESERNSSFGTSGLYNVMKKQTNVLMGLT